MKRFWDQATVAPDAGGWAVHLDGKPVRLPGGTPLHLPVRALAEAVAAEWQAAGGARGGEMSYADVPLTRIAGTAQERILPDPEPVAVELARYAQSDLLCYRAAAPAALVARQTRDWQPWLDWVATTYGACLHATEGVMHIAQPAESLAALATTVARRSPHALAALGVMVPILGSLVLALAVADGALEGSAAFALSQLDEAFQAEFWGSDSEAEIKRARDAADVGHAAHMLALLRQG